MAANASRPIRFDVVGGRARMQGNEVRTAEQLVDRWNLFDVGECDVGVVDRQRHPEGRGATCDALAHVPVPDEPEPVVAQVASHEPRAHPVVAHLSALVNEARGLRQPAREHHEERERQVGDGLCVLSGRVDQRHATAAQCLDVDVDRSAASAADQSQLARRVQHLLGHRRSVNGEHFDSVHPFGDLQRETRGTRAAAAQRLSRERTARGRQVRCIRSRGRVPEFQMPS